MAPALRRAVLAGLFLGAAADVKIPYLIFGAAAAWTVRHQVKQLLRMIGAAAVVLIPGYLWFGMPAVAAVLSRTTKVTADNIYQLLSAPSGFVFHHLLQFALGGVLMLAILMLGRLPSATARPAAPPSRATPVPALRTALALSCAWLFVWPYQLPWYDAIVICLLIFYPATQLDWIELARLTAGTVALIPGDPDLRAGWLIDRTGHFILTFWAPLLLLASVLAVIWLSVAGRWRANRSDSATKPMNSAIPTRT
jgi:hypothetical protein